MDATASIDSLDFFNHIEAEGMPLIVQRPPLIKSPVLTGHTILLYKWTAIGLLNSTCIQTGFLELCAVLAAFLYPDPDRKHYVCEGEFSDIELSPTFSLAQLRSAPLPLLVQRQRGDLVLCRAWQNDKLVCKASLKFPQIISQTGIHALSGTAPCLRPRQEVETRSYAIA